MLRKTVFVCICCCALLAAASSASAYNHPSSSTSYLVNLVRAYAPCTSPNAEHRDPAFPDSSCTPPLPSNAGSLDAWEFGSNGKIWVRYRVTKGDVLIDASGTGIGDGNGNYASGPGFLALDFNWTDNGCGDAPDFGLDCTNFDLPLYVSFNLTNGKFKVNTNANLAFNFAFNTTIPHWRSGSSIEVKDLQVLDETNEVFAVPGLYIR